MKYINKIVALLATVCLLGSLLCVTTYAEQTIKANWSITPTIGTTTVPLPGNDIVSVLEFTPGESGIFRFSLTGGTGKLYTLYGSMFAGYFHSLTAVSGNVLEKEIKESFAETPIMLGVSGTGTATLKIERIGDAGFDINALPYEAYAPTENLKKFDLPNDVTLTYVDVTAAHTAVKGADGYYHLDSVDGPVLYINMGGSAPYASIAAAASNGAMKTIIYDKNGAFVKKEEYITCINTYFGYTDNATNRPIPGYTDGGIYPLTDDFVYILQTYTEASGWNKATHPNYLFADETVDTDTAWMFCIGYDAEQLPGGTKNPYKVYGDTSITLDSGKSAYFVIADKMGQSATISGTGSFAVDGNSANGEYHLQINSDTATYLLANNSAATVTYLISFDAAVGSEENPELLVQGGSYVAPTDGYTYQYVVTEDGYLSIAVENGDCAYALNGASSTNSPERIDVVKGDVVTVTIYGTADIRWTLTVHTHSYAAASCLNPATCACGATSGDPLPHDYVSGEGICNGVGLSEDEYCGDDIRVYLTEEENTLEVPAGETVYFAGYYNGMNATFGGNDVTLVHNGMTYPVSGSITFKAIGSMRFPCVFAVTNNSTANATYTLNFTYPSGTMEAPELVTDSGDYTAPLDENTTCYFYSYTATTDGTLTVTMPENNWQYVINNQTKELYGETHWCDDNPTVPSEFVEFESGDVIEIMIAYYDPTFTIMGEPLDWTLAIHTHEWESEPSCAEDTTCANCDVVKPALPHEHQNGVCVSCGDDIRILLPGVDNTVTVPAGETLYYKGFFGGMLTTVTGEYVTVIHNGETYEVDGTVTFMSVGDTRNPSVYIVTNNSAEDAEYRLQMAFPVGTSGNPEAMEGNVQTITIEEGDEDGHYLSYTVTADGTLSIKVESASGWQFSVSNPEGSFYGDLHRSDDEEVISEETFDVKAGDVVIIMVSTLDPENPWSVPAGEISLTATWSEKAPSDNEEDPPADPEPEDKFPSLGIDLDDDGKAEMLLTEDMLVKTANGTGVDLNGDGAVDAMAIDKNDDGIIDGLDIDFDGIADLLVLEVETIVPDGPANNGGNTGNNGGAGTSPETGDTLPILACVAAVAAAALCVIFAKKAKQK